MTKEHASENNKVDLLQAVQDKLATLVASNFDGDIVIGCRKGYLGKVRSIPNTSQDVFDPCASIKKKRILTEN